MLPIFKKKINNSARAIHYRQNLIAALDQYQYHLALTDNKSEVLVKVLIIVDYIEFQHKYHLVYDLANKEMAAKISKEFRKEYRKQKKYFFSADRASQIVADFMRYIVINYGSQEQQDLLVKI